MTFYDNNSFQSLDFEKLQEMASQTQDGIRNSSYSDMRDIVRTYNNNQLLLHFNNSTYHNWESKPGFYHALAEEILLRIEQDEELNNDFDKFGSKALNIMNMVFSIMKLTSKSTNNKNTNKPRSNRWLYIISIVLLFLFIIFIPFLLLIAFIVLICRLFKKVISFRFNKIPEISRISPQLISKGISWIKLLLYNLILSYLSESIKHIAYAYYNGYISEQKARKIISRKFKIKIFKITIEKAFINKLDIVEFNHQSFIVTYYVFYLLCGLFTSKKAEINLRLSWIQCALTNGLYNDADILIKTSLEIVETISFQEEKAKLLHLYAFILLNNNHNKEAENILNQLIDFYNNKPKEYVMDETLADAYHLLGIVHRNLNNRKEGLKYLFKSLDYINKLITLSNSGKLQEYYDINGEDEIDDIVHQFCIDGYIQAYSRCCFNIGLIYHDVSNFDLAEKYYNLSLKEQYNLFKNPINKTLFNIIYQFNRFINTFDSPGNKLNDEKKFESLEISSLGIHALGNIGILYYEQKNYDEAISKFNEALRMARKIDDIYNERLWSFYLGLSYEMKDDFHTAYSYQIKAIECLEELRNILNPIDFQTAFDTLERRKFTSLWTGMIKNQVSWASIGRLSAIPRTPRVEDSLNIDLYNRELLKAI